MSVTERSGATAEVSAVGAGVTIDVGMHHWYDSCPCCLSAAYTEVKRILDEEGWAQPDDGGGAPDHSG